MAKPGSPGPAWEPAGRVAVGGSVTADDEVPVGAGVVVAVGPGVGVGGTAIAKLTSSRKLPTESFPEPC